MGNHTTNRKDRGDQAAVDQTFSKKFRHTRIPTGEQKLTEMRAELVAPTTANTADVWSTSRILDMTVAQLTGRDCVRSTLAQAG